MIKEDNPEYRIVGTNENEQSVLSTVCDEWYKEPVLNDMNYVEYCLQFCIDHDITVFMPRRGLLTISKEKLKFEAIGVKVMVDDYEIVSMLNYKDCAYKELSKRGVTSIPDYHIVTTVDGLEKAYGNLQSKYREICIKFVHDEGGKSFRLIDNSRKGYLSLFKKQNTRMTYDSIVEALSEREKFAPMMVMPYLSGEEISADCLNTPSGLIVLPRIKDTSRIERLCFDEGILTKIREIYDTIHLECPCNIQLKYLDGTPYFLEVNTRMSGGIQMACLAGDVNIPNIAVNKLLGIDKPWKICAEEKCVTHVESPVLL